MSISPITLTPELRAEYERLYAEADIPPEHQSAVTNLATQLASDANWPRYGVVADTLNIPPHVVALIHAMEASADFTRHLHNGDPLAARTVQVPAGLPATGEPPFTWEASAIDALRLHKLDQWSDWSIPGLCYVLERYNGWGYRRYHPHVKNPYLWSFTSVYTAGKYVADGKWSESAVSQQCGAMALLLELAKLGKPLPTTAAPDEEANDAPTPADVATTPAQPSSRVLSIDLVRDAPTASPRVGQPVGGGVSALLAILIPYLRALAKSKTMYGVVGMVALQLLGQSPWDIRLWVGGQIYNLPDLHPYVIAALGALATWGRITAKPIKGATHA